MKEEKVDMSLSGAVALYNILNDIMFDKDGKERELAFNVKYKIQRMITLMHKDFNRFEEARKELIQDMGVKDGDRTYIPDDKMDEFFKELDDRTNGTVSYDIIKLTKEEVNSLTIPSISSLEMTIFVSAMVEDEDYSNALK